MNLVYGQCSMAATSVDDTPVERGAIGSGVARGGGVCRNGH